MSAPATAPVSVGGTADALRLWRELRACCRRQGCEDCTACTQQLDASRCDRLDAFVAELLDLATSP